MRLFIGICVVALALFLIIITFACMMVASDDDDFNGRDEP